MKKINTSNKEAFRIIGASLLALSFLYLALNVEATLEMVLMAIIFFTTTSLFIINYEKKISSDRKLNVVAIVILIVFLIQKLYAVKSDREAFLVYGFDFSILYLYGYWVLIFVMLIIIYGLKNK